MDASDRANNNGNGKHVPETGSPPSAAAAPQGAPVGPSAAPAVEAQAGAPAAEPLVVVDADPPPKPKRLKRKQRAFIAAVAQTGNITAAAKLCKMARTSHYEWAEADPDYVLAFNAAMEEACDRLEMEARRRAEKGIREPVYYLGNKVGHVQKYSDTLLIFLLKGARPEKYRERYEHTGAGGKPLHPDHITVDVNVAYAEALKTLSDEELEAHNAIAAKLLARSGRPISPGAN